MRSLTASHWLLHVYTYTTMHHCTWIIDSDLYQQILFSRQFHRARIFKLLRSPRIYSKEPISPGCVAWRAGTTTLFLLGSQPQYKYGKYGRWGWNLVDLRNACSNFLNRDWYTIYYAICTCYLATRSYIKVTTPRKTAESELHNSLPGWQIYGGKFSCRSIFKKRRQMLWCLYS